ncbi:MAG: thioredoxin-disulfide reductase [Desulfovibrio sp.]|nr:thioredoxin-disulfide reductase [Desulfovibrio sp.]
MKSYDCVVIGGGPAGIAAALYLLRGGAKVAMVEKLSHGGQTLLTEEIENYPGFPNGIKGYELADLFHAHLEKYPHDLFRDEVRTIEPEPGRHRVLVGDEWLQARSIIIASGAAYKRLGLPREEAFVGRGVSFCALCDGNFYRGEEVAVVGGGNAALEESLYLSRIVNKVHLIHRRDAFRGERCFQDRCIADPKINIIYNTVVDDLVGTNKLEGLKLTNVKTGESSILNVAAMFVFIGFASQAKFVPPTLDVDKDGFIHTDVEMRTNIEGIFAAGDARAKLCRQVVTAVGDGATAAHSVQLYLG